MQNEFHFSLELNDNDQDTLYIKGTTAMDTLSCHSAVLNEIGLQVDREF